MVNSIVLLVTLPNPIVTSDPGFDSSASADTWDVGTISSIMHIDSTFILDINQLRINLAYKTPF